MKELTIKQQRKERKKMKLAALANFIQSNDTERFEKDTSNPTKVSQDNNCQLNINSNINNNIVNNSSTNKTESSVDGDGFIMVTNKKKNLKSKIDKSKETDTQMLKRKRLNSEDENNSTAFKSPTTIKRQPADADNQTEVMSDEAYSALRAEMRKRRYESTHIPAVHMREYGFRASLSVEEGLRVPIFLTDIQHLLMTALFGKKTPCPADRWCQFDFLHHLQHTVVVVLEGVSLFHYLAHESKFAKINEHFELRLEVTFPPHKQDGILEELLQAPLLYANQTELIKQHGCLEVAVDMNKDPTLSVNGVFKIEQNSQSHVGKENSNDEELIEKIDGDEDLPPEDKIPRTKLLLSALQMVDEGYPVPLRGELHSRFRNYVFTKSVYKPVTNRSPLFAVDCEMCKTTIGCNELTRISIVNEKLETVYETLVMPTNKITDYLTRYSGITADLMRTVTKNLHAVQEEVKELLPADAILVGQSLNSDLNAMRMMHPYVIDTSVCFNMTGVRRRKSKLAALALTFLKEAIQKHADGHDSVEDSLASIRLVKMKLANSLEFGDEVLSQKKRLHELLMEHKPYQSVPQLPPPRKETAVVYTGKVLPKIKQLIEETKETVAEDVPPPVQLIEEEKNKHAVKKAVELIPEKALTLVNLHYESEKFQQSAIDRTIDKINKMVTKLWRATPRGSLFVVVMGGSTECPGGVLQMAVKQSPAGPGMEGPSE